MKIGCIGQGFVGKNIADNLEQRGCEVVRYSLDLEHKDNDIKIAGCDAVFIGVPTPSTPKGFDYSIVQDVLKLVSDGSIAIIKSTLLPGTTKKLQDLYPGKIILFSPEFLCENTAAHDVENPLMNIIGLSNDTIEHQQAAELVSKLLPESEHNFTVSSHAAELFKYAHNLNGYFRVILSNLLYEVGEKNDTNWDDVKRMMDSDAMMSPYYNTPVHKGGRGAGGNCFVKDMAAFRHMYSQIVIEDQTGLAVLRSLEKKNIELLNTSGKSQDIIKGIYGGDIEK